MNAAATVDQNSVPHRGLITLSIMLATIMQVLDTTIANVALPSMTGRPRRLAGHDHLGADLLHRRGRNHDADDRAGCRTGSGGASVFIVSVVGFVLASMACGLAWSLGSMVAFRILQGLFGAAIVPLSQTFLLDINPREKHGQAMAMWGAGIMVGPIIGPTLGGWLTESFDWRWVFFINVPVGALALAGCLAFLPRGGDTAAAVRLLRLRDARDRDRRAPADARPRRRGRMVRLLRDLDSTRSWRSPASGSSACTSLTAREPFIDPRIFADRNFVTGLVFIFIIGIVLLREPRAAAADAVDHLRLSDDHDGARHGAARGGHDGLDDHRGPARPAGRPADTGRRRARG